MRNKSSRKRVPSVLAGSSRKKIKVEHDGADSLPWTTVSRPVETALDGDDGILELEEVEGVEVTYEETETGRVARFNVRRIITGLGSAIGLTESLVYRRRRGQTGRRRES